MLSDLKKLVNGYLGSISGCFLQEEEATKEPLVGETLNTLNNFVKSLISVFQYINIVIFTIFEQSCGGL